MNNTLHPAACFSWFGNSLLQSYTTPSLLGSLVVSSGSRWLTGEEGEEEGGHSAHGVDGKAGGLGLLWGVELCTASSRATGQSPQVESHPGRVSCACTLAREGLVSGHQNCPHPGRDNSFTEDEVTTPASWETGNGITWET